MRIVSLLPIYFILSTCSGKIIPAIFIFGDSLYDCGNNLYIDTLAKPVPPNGIDFGTGGSSGRYTNGRTIADIIGQELGFSNFTPPYLAPTTVGDIILKGVNYASSAAGIFNDTGNNFGDHISFDMQISYFAKTKHDIISRIGRQAAKSLLGRSLYLVAIGANDILKEMNSFGRSVSLDAYLNNMISRFRFRLRELYNLGARKIMVTSVGPLGCIPYSRDRNPPGDSCIGSFNQQVQLYNNKLKVLLQELTTSNANSIYVYADAYAILEEVIQNYVSYGFDNAECACCHIAGIHGGLVPCISGSIVCPDRSKYVFWDAYHPTEAVNLIAANYVMDGGLNYMSPMNVQQLVNF